jgi:Zn-dependent protease
VSFLIHFYVIPIIVSKSRDHITNNLGKFYLSVIFSLFLVILEVMMHDYQYNVMSGKWYIAFGSLLALFVYLYRKQVGIKDKEFVKGALEHHSKSLLISQEILNKTNDYNITKLAKNIIQTQKDQIQVMKSLLEE